MPSAGAGLGALMVPGEESETYMTDPHELGLVSVKEAAEMVGRNQSQLYRAIRYGELHYVARDRLGGLLRREDVEDWARAHPKRLPPDLPTVSEYARQIGAVGASGSGGEHAAASPHDNYQACAAPGGETGDGRS